MDFGLLRVLTDSDIYRTCQAYGLTHVDKPYVNCQMYCFNVYIYTHINIYPNLLNPRNFSGSSANPGFTRDLGENPGFFRQITGL